MNKASVLTDLFVERGLNGKPSLIADNGAGQYDRIGTVVITANGEVVIGFERGPKISLAMGKLNEKQSVVLTKIVRLCGLKPLRQENLLTGVAFGTSVLINSGCLN